MKKVISLLTLTLCFVVLSVCAFSVQAATCDTYDGSNVSAQSYRRWSAPVLSYLSPCTSGNIMRFQAADSINGYLVEYYSNSYEFKSKKIISKELPIFGAFYETSSNYFILSGQENPKESASVEVFRITKYDKNWNKLSSVSLKDCNTTIPFEAGSARIAAWGNSLIIRTCHEMYKTSDGLNHQANVTIVVDISSMRITDARTHVWNSSNGYVSHSFNQFVKTDSDTLAFLDHGDAYPRSVVLFTQKGNGSLNCYDLVDIPGSIGDNTTGVTVGGFEISSTSYLAAMANVDLNSNYKTNKIRNIYVASAERNSNGTIDKYRTKINRITYYTKESESASTPQLVRLSSEKFLLLWESEDKVNYCYLDSKGNMVGSIYDIKGNLSDCVPVVYNGNVIWYTWNGRFTSFYEIKENNLSDATSKIAENGHKYVNKGVSGNKATLVCSVCGDKATVTVATDFKVLWKKGESASGTYSTVLPSDLSDNDVLRFDVSINQSVDNDEVEIFVSDANILSAPMFGKSGVVKIIGHGEATVTFRLRYNPDVSKTFNINTHKNQTVPAVEATCTSKGLTSGTVCSVCSAVIKKQESIPALGHDFGKDYVVDKKATCTEAGQKSYHCSRCSEIKGAVKIPATGHNFEPWKEVLKAGCVTTGTQSRICKTCKTVETQKTNAIGHSYSKEWTVDKAATCISEGSKSHHCIRCDSKKDVTKIDFSEHNFGKWSLVKAASCTEDGVENRKCKVCDYTETRSVMRLGHKEAKDNAVEPSCLYGGKTEGSHCLTCGKVLTAQKDIAALGHKVVTDARVEPTCTARGKTEGSHCSRCNFVIVKQEMIPEKGHKLVTDKKVEPTCEKSGKTEGSHCSVCGYVAKKQTVVAAKGHKFIDTVTKKTCTTDGYTTHECSVCGYTYRDKFVYATGHKEVTIKQVKETCTKDGLSVKTYCANCGKVFSQSQVIPATGHKYVTTTVKATTSKNGKKTKKCSNCGLVSSQTDIPKITSIKLSATSYIYDATAKKPTVTVKDAKGKTLKSGTDYSVTYDSGRKKPGTYYVTVKFKGNYSGSKSLKFTIKVPPLKNLKLTAKSKSVDLKWDSVKGAEKYEIYYSTEKNGKFVKLATVTKNSYTAKKLKSGKTYYFKVRAVSTSSGGEKVYGAYSSVKSVKVK